MPKFPTKITGHDILFDEPYWLSDCGWYRLARMKCLRPWRLFRRLRKGFKNGHPWIGVGSGFKSKTEAILAANKHKMKLPVD